eukprot:20360-Heterococcus_DN1.PRE.1
MLWLGAYNTSSEYEAQRSEPATTARCCAFAAERATQKLLELSVPQNERVQKTWHALAARGYYREAAASANDALMLRTHHDCLC